MTKHRGKCQIDPKTLECCKRTCVVCGRGYWWKKCNGNNPIGISKWIEIVKKFGYLDYLKERGLL